MCSGEPTWPGLSQVYKQSPGRLVTLRVTWAWGQACWGLTCPPFTPCIEALRTPRLAARTPPYQYPRCLPQNPTLPPRAPGRPDSSRLELPTAGGRVPHGKLEGTPRPARAGHPSLGPGPPPGPWDPLGSAPETDQGTLLGDSPGLWVLSLFGEPASVSLCLGPNPETHMGRGRGASAAPRGPQTFELCITYII